MRYMGSKRRIAKEILPIILKNRYPGQWYVEPFCGGCNTLSEVQGNRIGNDIHKYLIEMWKAVSLGWLPPQFIIKDQFLYIKANKDLDPILAGYAGFELTFGNKWMDSYVTYESQDKWQRGRKDEQAYKNSLLQFPKLLGVTFLQGKYEDLDIPKNSLIYCDPPYEDTKQYRTGKFNHTEFWQWCRDKVKEGHTVYISEYNAPVDFVSVWEKNISSTMGNTGTKGSNKKRATEKLFIHRSQL